MLRPRLNGLLPVTPGLHSPSVFPCLIQCPCVTGKGEEGQWHPLEAVVEAEGPSLRLLSITVSSPEVGGTDQTPTRVWTGRRRKRRLCRGSREAGHSCSGDPHLFCSRGLAAPGEWVQEAEGPVPMLGCQVAWCQGDVWRRMEAGGRRWGEEKGGCPSLGGGGGRALSVEGGRREGRGRRGEEGWGPHFPLYQWTPQDWRSGHLGSEQPH